MNGGPAFASVRAPSAFLPKHRPAPRPPTKRRGSKQGVSPRALQTATAALMTATQQWQERVYWLPVEKSCLPDEERDMRDQMVDKAAELASAQCKALAKEAELRRLQDTLRALELTHSEQAWPEAPQAHSLLATSLAEGMGQRARRGDIVGGEDRPSSASSSHRAAPTPPAVARQLTSPTRRVRRKPRQRPAAARVPPRPPGFHLPGPPPLHRRPVAVWRSLDGSAPSHQ